MADSPLIQQAPSRALDGVRVLDLTRLLPGPYATYVLTGYGADVIKIEDTGAGDYARYSEPLPSSGFGAAFTACNAGKRSVALDLKSTDGHAAFLKLVDIADVIVESFRPGVMQRLQLGYETLREQRPDLIYCSISGYGQNSSLAALAGHDLNFQGQAGLLAQREQGSGYMPPALLGDLVGGSLSAAIAIMGAVLERKATGNGRYIDISIAHGVMSLLPFDLVASANSNTWPAFGDTSLTGKSPFYGLYEAADGRLVALAAHEPKFWRKFCERAGLQDLEQAPLSSFDAAFKAKIRERLVALFKTRTSAEWERCGIDWDVCLGPVLSTQESLARTRAEGIALENHYLHKAREVRVLKGITADLAEPVRKLSPPPLHGEHTQEVLKQAGFDNDWITRCHSSGAVGGKAD